MKTKNKLLLLVILLFSNPAFSQFIFKKNIESENVFLPRFISNKFSLKQKIAANYYISGQTMGNKLVIYLASKNDQAFIEGKRGSYYILIPKELQVDEPGMKISFLNAGFGVIESAYIHNLEDIIYKIVKKLPEADNIADIVEYCAKIFGVVDLENIENRISVLNPKNFNGIRLNWDSQFNNGHWVKAHYVKFEIPFSNKEKFVNNALKQDGFGMFIYFQPSILNNPSVVYMEIPGLKQGAQSGGNRKKPGVLQEQQQMGEGHRTEVKHKADETPYTETYLIKMKGGGGYESETIIEFNCSNKPVKVTGKGFSDDEDNLVRVGISNGPEDFKDFSGDSWTTINGINSTFYVLLNSKWGTDNDTYAELKVTLPKNGKISYSKYDNHSNNLDYVKIIKQSH